MAISASGVRSRGWRWPSPDRGFCVVCRERAQKRKRFPKEISTTLSPMPVDTELTEIKLDRIHEIFMENGFKGGPDEARRIGQEILDVVEMLDSEADEEQ